MLIRLSGERSFKPFGYLFEKEFLTLFTEKSKYDKEIPQSRTADQPWHHVKELQNNNNHRDTRKTKKVKHIPPLSVSVCLFLCVCVCVCVCVSFFPIKITV